jgi:excisionase family DNA binding protein
LARILPDRIPLKKVSSSARSVLIFVVNSWVTINEGRQHMDEFMNIMEVSNMLHLHANSVSRLASKGDIPSLKIGRRRLFKKRDILRWVEKQNNQSKK